MSAPYVEKLLIGQVKQLGVIDAKNPLDRKWESGIFKECIEEKVWLGTTGLSGDEIADKKNHGGPEKAIFAYPVDHYDFWKNELNLDAIGIGAMGENIAIQSLDESTVCIGDTYTFGDAVIQVSQPRQPCWKPARRFRIVDFALRIQKTGRTGWYFRVLQEGYVQGNIELTLLERPYPEWTVARSNKVMHERKKDLELAKKLLSCELLAENWKNTLTKRVAGESSSVEKRVYGPNVDFSSLLSNKEKNHEPDY